MDLLPPELLTSARASHVDSLRRRAARVIAEVTSGEHPVARTWEQGGAADTEEAGRSMAMTPAWHETQEHTSVMAE